LTLLELKSAKQLMVAEARSPLTNSLVTGKITGKFFLASRKAAWIAGFRNFNVQKQGINRE